jgi:uncharacterized oxidoreductase
MKMASSAPTVQQALTGAKLETPAFTLLQKYKPLDLTKAVVLITGGSSGIGLALCDRYIKAGSTVLTCGRREDELKKAKEKLNCDKFHTFQCDIGSEDDRVKLFDWATKTFPNLNILVNNAGIQRRVPEAKENESWKVRASEIAVNFEGPIHLCHLFIPHLIKHGEAAIINVSSGTAFTGAAFGPVYAASKAGIHSYTISLRYSLAKTGIQVIELIPPAVHTNLGGGHSLGENLDEFTDCVFKRISDGEPEVGFKFSETARLATREQTQTMFNTMNGALKVPQF